ncbi:DNA-binding transcriptional regulator YhcF (GntR family) [Metabacillus crassostreae]|nr:anti-repressor SinI family protein [Metabacillus crassostreae]MBM7602209.1 DNA-binding transcriptional regulator YhcF (GntR family) [Metabacillus crassostreae]
MNPVLPPYKFAELDCEWTALIQEALEMGITKEEIIFFLKSYPSIDQKL